MVFISFLVPTRKRFNLLVDSINSIVSKAKDNKYEILLAMDNDDDTAENVKEFIQSNKYENIIKLFMYERQYYHNLHVYINDLCSKASGDYLLLWNDDARIVSDNWDIIINDTISKQDKLYMYQLENNHAWECFPMIPKEWYNRMGHFSLNAHNDSWVRLVGEPLNAIRTMPVKLWHLRGDDARNNIYTEVDTSYTISSPDFHSLENKRLRDIDTQILSSLYK